MQNRDVPLCVDLDGTLIRTDMLLESALALVRRNPFYLFCFIVWLARGRACLKRQIAARADVDVTTLPYDTRVLAWLRERDDGRRRVLCTASDQRWADAVAGHVGGFDEAIGSDGVRNLGGRGKALALCERYGERGFDYAGNAATDLHVWRHARRAIVVSARAGVLARAQGECEVEHVFDRQYGGWRAWLAALRPYQWVKNALVFVPLLAAHELFLPGVALRGAFAFVAFCLCASAAYLLNDLLDLDADRRHPRKRTRPFASGALPLEAGLVAAPLLTVMAFAAAFALSPTFMLLLLVYAVATLAYSLALKRMAMLDVLTLAALYTVRIVGGAVAIPVPASSWLLAFSMFLFFGLAMLKRYIEVRGVVAADQTRVAGRGYGVGDLAPIRMLGLGSGYVSVLVLALYINSTKSESLYRHYHLLWLLVPILLYWTSRAWLLAQRDCMHDDPIVFALTDTVSLAALVACAFVITLAI